MAARTLSGAPAPAPVPAPAPALALALWVESTRPPVLRIASWMRGSMWPTACIMAATPTAASDVGVAVLEDTDGVATASKSGKPSASTGTSGRLTSPSMLYFSIFTCVVTRGAPLLDKASAGTSVALSPVPSTMSAKFVKSSPPSTSPSRVATAGSAWATGKTPRSINPSSPTSPVMAASVMCPTP